MHPLAYTHLGTDIHKLITKAKKDVLLVLYKSFCVQQHAAVFLRGFFEELHLAFIWIINVKGVPFSSNNILGVLTVCSLCTSRREDAWNIWNWWDTYVPAAVICYPSLYASWCTLSLHVCLLCFPWGTSLQTLLTLGIPLSVNDNSIRTKFEGLGFFLRVHISQYLVM